jgi:hypothetical protein
MEASRTNERIKIEQARVQNDFQTISELFRLLNYRKDVLNIKYKYVEEDDAYIDIFISVNEQIKKLLNL